MPALQVYSITPAHSHGVSSELPLHIQPGDSKEDRPHMAPLALQLLLDSCRSGTVLLGTLYPLSWL